MSTLVIDKISDRAGEKGSQKVSDKVFDKTDKGREEIATRKYRVAPRLRTLLVMIDGRRPLAELMTNFSALGVTEDTFAELLEQELIALVEAGEPALPSPHGADLLRSPRAPATAARPPHPMAAPGVVGADIDHTAVPAQRAYAPDPPPVAILAGSATAAAPDALTDADRFRALAAFYNQTIKSTIGLRGILLQLRAEKCASIDDFRDMRLVFLEAVYKAKGREMAVSLRDRLDQLLGGKPATDPFQPD